MKTFTTLKNLFGSLSQNTSTTNLTLGAQMINDQHRYLLQKYFDNERTVQITTVGAQSLTTTATLATAAVSATLIAVWSYPTVTQLVNFSNGNQRSTLFTKSSTSISWTGGLSSSATTAITTIGVQDYVIPPNISKIKDSTITVGQLRYTPIEIKTQIEWDLVNTLPYVSDIPQYFRIWNGNLSLWPIPSTTGNLISFNYKTRVADLSFVDYTTGTISGATVGSTSITGTSTAWLTTGAYPSTTDITFYNLCLRIDPPYGDGVWYPISQFTSGTALTLVNPIINAPNITASSTYTIGQVPLLSEDFHDMLVYGGLKLYFSSIVDNPGKYKEFSQLYAERLELLAEYAGVKALDVDLGNGPQFQNPNLYIYSNS